MQRIALLSDIHANLEALEAVLRSVEPEKPDLIVVLGDTINYGPNPRECLEMVDRLADIMLAGNHETEATRPESDDMEGDAKEMLEWTVAQLNEFPPWEKLRQEILDQGEDRAWLRYKDLTFVHGSARKPVEQYVWPGHPHHHLQLNRQLDDHLLTILKGFRTKHSFCGHTHAPAVLAGYDDREICPIGCDWNRHYTFIGPRTVFYVPEESVTLEGLSGRKVVINPGSVGQPRDGNPLASWALYDGDAITFHRVVYDQQKTSAKINALPLSADTREFFAERLAQGI
jgi:predicted phosphodiesterase